MTSIRITIAASLLLLGVAGCSNACEKLVERVCEPASADLATCQGLPADPKDPAKAQAACERMKAVVLSCPDLKDKAKEAGQDDLAACKADLEVIRALEKQMQ